MRKRPFSGIPIEQIWNWCDSDLVLLYGVVVLPGAAAPSLYRNSAERLVESVAAGLAAAIVTLMMI
ncbi:hypothetical protein SAMN05421503_3438 [Terribacillus aidingensis]|uniref:Uncharacterized protein n=1 Tax=Terribacillus aidingensis TaxID=586416 RepID=A0A285PD04_9BACI|nr:hypothetical protein SAMN05421503_3438 [Terribacillus aidingensis]